MAVGRELVDYSEVLKTKYAPKMPVLFAIDNEMEAFLPLHGSTLGGDGLILPTEISPDVSGGAAGPMDAIPAPGKPDFNRYKIWGSYMRRQGVVWDEAVDYTKGEGSYVDALQHAMDRSVDWMKHMRARDMFWGRHEGISTVASQAGGAGHITVRATYAVGGSVSSLADYRGTRYLVKGQRFNVVDPATGTLRLEAVTGYSTFYIVDIISATEFHHGCIDASGNEVAATQLLTGGGGLATGDLIVPAGSFHLGATPETQLNARGYQTYGFDEIISDGNDITSLMYQSYGLLDRSVVTETSSLVYAPAGPLTNNPDMIRRMSMAIAAKSGMEWNGDLVCNPALLETIPPMVSGTTWYTPQTAPLGMPDSAIVWNPGNGNKKFRTSNLCPPNTVYFIDRNHMHRFKLRELSFDTRGGGILKPYVAGGSTYPATSFWLQEASQIFSDQPNRHGKLTNLTGVDDQFGMSTFFQYIR